MKNFLMKHAHIIICTFVLTTLLFISISKEKNQSKLYFYIESDSGIVKILPHISSDGRCYVFLPSYAQMENLHIEIPPEMNIFLNEINLSEQTNFDIFELSVDYDCVLNNEVTTTLQFLQSANVATLHIDTVTGTMDAIHESKLNEEFATIALYESNGKLNHLDKACTIKGRGNSTWSYDKKPYSLELSSSSNLLNMGSSSNWILLANAVDESNLHNKIIYDLANELHMSGSPDCRYVDVYLNGSYNGLYLLTTKIEINTNRLDISLNDGDFFGKIELNERLNTLTNPIITDSGRIIEITEPKKQTADTSFQFKTLIDEFEKTIYSSSNLSNSTNIDLNSWIKKYLIDEISGNIDSDLASSYFYYSGGKFYGGPIWDYDMTFGNCYRNKVPDSFIAKNYYKSNTHTSPYYNALYNNNSFYTQMVEIYQQEFLPLLEVLINNSIVTTADSIAASSYMNSIRWADSFYKLYTQIGISSSSADTIINYLQARLTFLNDVWINGTEYCSVQIEPDHGFDYKNLSIKKGTTLNTSYIDLSQSWINKYTGEFFDPNKPITEDIILVLP